MHVKAYAVIRFCETCRLSRTAPMPFRVGSLRYVSVFTLSPQLHLFELDTRTGYYRAVIENDVYRACLYTQMRHARTAGTRHCAAKMMERSTLVPHTSTHIYPNYGIFSIELHRIHWSYDHQSEHSAAIRTVRIVHHLAPLYERLQKIAVQRCMNSGETPGAQHGGNRASRSREAPP